MRIKNTEHERKPTRRLYDADIMAGVYDPPGVEFSSDQGIARVREAIGEALVEKYDHLSIVEQDSGPDESSASDGETTSDDTEDTDN